MEGEKRRRLGGQSAPVACTRRTACRLARASSAADYGRCISTVQS